MTYPAIAQPTGILTAVEREKHAHQLILDRHGPDAQARLKAARVAVVGADEIGSPVIAQLADAGVGGLTIVDGAPLRPWDGYLGLPSTGASSRSAAWHSTLARSHPQLAVEAVQQRIDASNATAVLATADVVVCGSEDPARCQLISDACGLLGIPYVWAALSATVAHVSVFWAGHGPVFRDLPAEAITPYFRGMAGIGPVTGPTAGMFVAAEVIKLLTGTGRPLIGRVLSLDVEAPSAEVRPLQARERAPQPIAVQSAEPYFGLLTADAATAARDATISVEQLKAMLDGNEPIALIDVREPHEFSYAHIVGSVLVPQGEFFEKDAVNSLPTDKRPVFICRAGIRSAEVLAVAKRAGRDDAVHVGGGVVAWAERIDPTMPSY
jgi:molybdopterin/thiamine biosynthesis adenylyltransferase/rhodanese-related sulfurtransferase